MKSRLRNAGGKDEPPFLLPESAIEVWLYLLYTGKRFMGAAKELGVTNIIRKKVAPRREISLVQCNFNLLL